MTADLDMSPEAVERLAEALEAQEQADMDGARVKVSRQACDEGAATLRALAAENERLRAERDAARQDGAEVERLRGMLNRCGVGPAERYWEDRWRDEAADNDRLRAERDAIALAICLMPRHTS